MVFRQMADMSNDAFYLCDEHGHFLYVNDRSITSIGYTMVSRMILWVWDMNIAKGVR
jgi:PAS domain S-box-containing protein